ncbi:hypothetical protein BDN71DRAFT_1593063 [Pleurotus eryngii]|uniref:MYND-type domain-containing protein n=1 Tax=Pleurotus eryngii TaxID=5323 RepID=A0A9P6DAW7_PLEER|nr:hypothetical protein BDN71DRAFT_1593063 [Pleurotus eryngii]
MSRLSPSPMRMANRRRLVRFQRRRCAARTANPTTRVFGLHLSPNTLRNKGNNIPAAKILTHVTTILNRNLSSPASNGIHYRMFMLRLTRNLPAIIALTKQLIESCDATPFPCLGLQKERFIPSMQHRFEVTTNFIYTFLSPRSCSKTAITLAATRRPSDTVGMFLPLAVDAWQCHSSNEHLRGVPIVNLIEAIANLAYTSLDPKPDPQLLSSALATLKHVLPSSSRVDQPRRSFVLKLVELIRRAVVSTPLSESYRISRYKRMRLIMHAMVFFDSAPSEDVYTESGFECCLDILMLATRGRREGVHSLFALIEEGFGDSGGAEGTRLTPLDYVVIQVVTQCMRLPFLRIVLEVLSSPDYRKSTNVNIRYIAEQRLLHGLVAKDLIRPRCNACKATTRRSKKLLQICGGCSSVYYCSVKCQRRDWKQHRHHCRITQDVYMLSSDLSLPEDDREHIKLFTSFYIHFNHKDLMADWAGFTAQSHLRIDIDFRQCPPRARGCFQASSPFPNCIPVHVIVPTILCELGLIFTIDPPSNVTRAGLFVHIYNLRSPDLHLLDQSYDVSTW